MNFILLLALLTTPPPAFDAAEVIRRAGIGTHSPALEAPKRIEVRAPAPGRWERPKRCRVDLSRPAQPQIICDVEDKR